MNCNCENISIAQKESIEEIESRLIQLSVDGFRWKTLYKCNVCNVFWEEHYIDGRFGGEPQLLKVSDDYVLKEWGEKYVK